MDSNKINLLKKPPRNFIFALSKLLNYISMVLYEVVVELKSTK